MLNISTGRRDLVVALLGRGVSTFGDGIALVALTLRLQAEGAHPYAVGLLLAAGTMPLLLLAGPVGRLVDTHDSRRLLIGGGLVELAATVPLIFVHSVAPIVALAAVLGGASSVTAATWSALLPRIVGDDHLPDAISAQQSLGLLVLVGAPAVGGLLAGAFGTSLPLAIDALSFVVVTVAAASIHTRRVPEPIGSGTGSSERIRGGLAILRSDPVLARLLAGVALVVLLVGMADVVLVYLVRETLHAGGIWYGVTQASWIAGMVAGAVGAAHIRTETGRVRTTLAGAALTCAGVASFALAPTASMLIPLSILGGIGNGYAGTCLSTLLMTRTPDQARGRISATANAILGGAQGASLLIGGVVALALSPRAIYATAGLLGLAATATLVFASASRTASVSRPVDARAA
jgi:MFS family permease